MYTTSPHEAFCSLCPQAGIPGVLPQRWTDQGLRRLREASSFQLGSMASLLLLWAAHHRALHSGLYPACRGKKNKAKLRVEHQRHKCRSRQEAVHPCSSHSQPRSLLPLQSLWNYTPHLKEPASFPGLNLAVCSPRPTPGQFQSELWIKQSKLL